MTDPIGTAQERELMEWLRRSVTDTTAFCPSPKYRNPDGPKAADALQSRIAEVGRLNAECERAWESQKIAYEQAMANGEALSDARAEVGRLKERVWKCNGDPEEFHGVTETQTLRNALERLSRNFDLLLAGKPVRDVAEAKAEVSAALSLRV